MNAERIAETRAALHCEWDGDPSSGRFSVFRVPEAPCDLFAPDGDGFATVAWSSVFDPAKVAKLVEVAVNALPELLDHIERLRGLVAEAHRPRVPTTTDLRRLGIRSAKTIVFCGACDFIAQEDSPGAAYAKHGAHVAEILNGAA